MQVRPIVFGEEETNRVLDQMSLRLKDSVSLEVVKPVTLALERIKEIFNHLLLLPEVPAATVRINTLQTLLRHFEVELADKYSAILLDAGRAIGRSFADDFVKTLHNINRIPMNLRSLIKIWLEIESNAKWGIFDFDESNENKITIHVTDFFLTRSLSDHIHRNCAFMEGYIDSFLWEATKTCSRWYYDAYGTRVIEKFLEPVLVKDNPFGAECRFEITLKTEELTEAFDEFYIANKYYLKNDYKSVALSLRTALEIAFKTKIGIDSSKQVPVTSIIRSFRNLNLLSSLPYRTIKDLYGRTSAIIHAGIKKPNKNDIRTLVRDAEYVLREIELIVLTDSKKKKLNETIKTLSQKDL